MRERYRDHAALPRREELDDAPIPQAELTELVEQTRQWPGEFVLLQVGEEVRVEVGAWGAAPLYLAATSGPTTSVLSGSWDITDHHHLMRADRLDERSVVEHLVLQTPYTSRTLWRDVICLTERARASWRPGGPLRMTDPTDAVHYRPRVLRPDADPLLAYEGLIGAAVRSRDVRAGDVVIEVSGGTDSATVAVATRDAVGSAQLSCYGMLVGGLAADQQRARRAAVVAAATLTDATVDATTHPPLAPPAPGRLINPRDEPYQDATAAALAVSGRPVVVTGIGGDELFAVRPDERPPADQVEAVDGDTAAGARWLTRWARDLARQVAAQPLELPVSVVPETALRACAVRAPVFLRAGSWPVAPLCSPDLVRFGEWMPLSWRSGKRLPREWLVHRGLPRELVWPGLRENFEPVMQHALRVHGLPQLRTMLAEGSVLIDLGFLDPDGLATALRDAEAATERGASIDATLHEPMALERALRTLLP